jgi:hypothetical protein
MNFNNATTTLSPSTDVRAIAANTGLLAGSNWQNGPRGTAQLYIMKGVMPTTFTGLTSFATRSADVLVPFSTSFSNFTNSGSTPQDFSPSTAGVNTHPVALNTNYVFATASGTATWFWWIIREMFSGSTGIGNNLCNQIIGSIGTPGSGADMEIPSVAIVSGQAYRVRNLVLSFPQTWTW